MSPSPDDVIARHALRRLGASLAGRYQLRRLIGVGGMAAVYAGVHRNGHAVAIKILHERLSSDPEMERLFRREALLANKIGHPGVVPVIDDDVAEDGSTFLVMPLLLGETLRARAHRLGGRLPVEQVVVIGHAVLEVLAAAHAQRIVHRDIKPENLFITADGDLRVLDFGIARFFETADPASATRSGRAVGTPAFMAPEQALGRLRDIDGRTDLWAVGATMFALLAGRFVHEGDTGNEILVRAATRPAPPIDEAAPEVPLETRAVIDKALAFDRQARWPDASAMARALREASGESTFATSRIAPSPGLDLHDDVHAMATHTSLVGRGRDEDIPGATERLPAASTRTASAAVVAARPQRTPQSAARRVAVILGAAAAATLAAVVVIGPLRSRIRTASEAAMAHERPPAASASPSAAEQAFQEAMHLWHDASVNDALGKLREATTLAPSYAQAHLYYALLSPEVDSPTRAHYLQAADARSTLSTSDLALLTAIAPLFQDPPDWTSTEAHLVTLTTQRPELLDATLTLARRQQFAGQFDAALSTADTVLRSHSDSPMALQIRATALVGLSRLDDARTSFRDCLAISPFATSCLDLYVQLEANEGHCDTAEALSRQIIAASPDSPDGYEYLAGAVFARTHSVEATRAIIAQRHAHLSAAIRAQPSFKDDVAMAMVAGDFDQATRILNDWENSVASSTRPYDHLYPAGLRVSLAIELGDMAKARRLSSTYYAQSQAWFADSSYDDIGLLKVRYLTGDLSRGDFLRSRDAWLAADHGGAESPTERWIDAYLGVTDAKQDAEDAIAHLPSGGAFLEATQREADVDFAIGSMYLHASRVSDAIPLLRRAVNSCSYDHFFDQVQAYAALGEALAAEHVDSEACSCFGVVLDHWGRDTRSTTAIRARKSATTLHCPLSTNTKQGPNQ